VSISSDVRWGRKYLDAFCIRAALAFILDIDFIWKGMIDDTLKKNINLLGNGKYPRPDGYRLVVKDRVVVTIEN